LEHVRQKMHSGGQVVNNECSTVGFNI